MGLTIHYQFSLNNATLTQAREKVTALRNLALQLPFVRVDELVEIAGDACNFDQDNVDDPHALIKVSAGKPIEIAMDEYYWQNPTYIMAFNSIVGEGSENPVFGLAIYSAMKDVNDWSWTGFCKTQYASNPEYGGWENFLKCHLLIVKMLDFAGELGITCDITDETGYWEHRSIEKLAEILHQHNILIAAFTGKLKDDLAAKGIVSTQASIFDYPNFEYLEAEGKSASDL
jgi:hypothetical protein